MKLLRTEQIAEVSIKLVYYGPAGAGKRGCLRELCRLLPRDPLTAPYEIRWQEPEYSPFVFFDFVLPGTSIEGCRTVVSVYTLSDFAKHPETRKAIFNDVDGIVFIADSEEQRQYANLEALAHLQEYLCAADLSLNAIPHIFQYNKTDLANRVPVSRMQSYLNPSGVPSFETTALHGAQVLIAFGEICQLTTNHLLRQLTQHTPQSSSSLTCPKWYGRHQFLSSVCQQIESLPEVGCIMFIGYDGLTITDNATFDQRFVAIALSTYINSANAIRQMGQKQLHQLVCRSNRGHVIIADFNDGILVVETSSSATESLMHIEREILSNLITWTGRLQ